MNFNDPSVIARIKQDLKESMYYLDDSDIQNLAFAQNINRLIYKKNSVILDEGDKFNSIFFIAKGFVKAYRDFDNKKIFMRFLAPGEFIGFSLLTENDAYYPYSLISLQESVIYSVDSDSIVKEMYNHPQFLKWLINYFSRQINELYFKNASQNTKHMNGRVAEVLLHFAEDIFKSVEFQLPISKKELGHLCNVSPENITRVFHYLISENMISYENKIIKILDYNRLIQLNNME